MIEMDHDVIVIGGGQLEAALPGLQQELDWTFL